MRENKQSIQQKPEKAVQIAIYLTGFFSLSLQTMIILLIPLYTLSLGASPFMIGLAVSAFSILPMFLSIKSGSLIDLIGSRKVILLCTILMIIFIFLHPLSPIVWVIFILQLVVGQVQTMTWIAAQTHVTKIQRKYRDASIVGVFSFTVSLGTFVGPLLTGYFWDLFGPWGGFLFVCGWAICLFLSALKLKEETQEHEGRSLLEQGEASRNGVSRKLLYLLTIPAVLMVVFGTFIRLSGSSMRGSFYLVYLEEISLPVMQITILYSLFALMSSVSPLFTKMAIRFIAEKKLLFLTCFLYLIPLIITPVFHQFWSFFILAVISGFVQGMTLPLLISLLAKSVPQEVQGVAVGLREMSNRCASVFVPLVFGISVEQVGLEASFYVVGAVLLGSILFIAPILLMLDKRFQRVKG